MFPCRLCALQKFVEYYVIITQIIVLFWGQHNLNITGHVFTTNRPFTSGTCCVVSFAIHTAVELPVQCVVDCKGLEPAVSLCPVLWTVDHFLLIVSQFFSARWRSYKGVKTYPALMQSTGSWTFSFIASLMPTAPPIHRGNRIELFLWIIPSYRWY